MQDRGADGIELAVERIVKPEIADDRTVALLDLSEGLGDILLGERKVEARVEKIGDLRY